MTEHTITRLAREAARLADISFEELLGPRRYKEVARVRFAVMLVARDLNYSQPDIGKRLGNRDHTTVWHGTRQAKVLLKAEDVVFAHLVASLRKAAKDAL